MCIFPVSEKVFMFYVFFLSPILVGMEILATLVALHLTPVSKRLSGFGLGLRTSVAWSLRACFLIQERKMAEMRALVKVGANHLYRVGEPKHRIRLRSMIIRGKVEHSD